MGYRHGPIVIIEDDKDDQEILKEVFQVLQVPNQLKIFGSCDDAYHYLETTTDKPFIIFSDINMPRMSGTELKRKINLNRAVRSKCIPFIFLTTASNQEAVLESYENAAQGFFTKPNSFQGLQQMIELILSYWKTCRHPIPC